ncbi:MAG: hypothetical protein AAGE01_11070 [Pseudomonadota bacterium]
MIRKLLAPSLVILVLTACAPSAPDFSVALEPAGDPDWTLRAGPADNAAKLELRLTSMDDRRSNVAEQLDGPVALGAVDPATLADVRVVTRVLVDRPWYAPDWFIIRRFRESIPVYEAIPGLVEKVYVIAADGRFGGVYFWRSLADAQAFYDDAWSERITERYGAPANLAYWSISNGAGKGDGDDA